MCISSRTYAKATYLIQIVQFCRPSMDLILWPMHFCKSSLSGPDSALCRLTLIPSLPASPRLQHQMLPGQVACDMQLELSLSVLH